MTAFYSKVGRLTYKDPTFNIRADFRVKIIDLKQLRCVANCPVTKGESFTPATCRSGRGVGIVEWIGRGMARDTKNLKCPGCGGPVEVAEPVKGFKMYVNVDNRIAAEKFLMTLLLHKVGRSSDPFMLPGTNILARPIVSSDEVDIRTLRMRKASFGFGKYLVLKQEFYYIFHGYDSMVQALSTMTVVKPNQQSHRSKKTSVVWKAAPIPSLQVMEDEFAKFQARKFGARL